MPLFGSLIFKKYLTIDKIFRFIVRYYLKYIIDICVQSKINASHEYQLSSPRNPSRQVLGFLAWLLSGWQDSSARTQWRRLPEFVQLQQVRQCF